MGFCPMACASPMLARMTSVKGFFMPWEGGGRTVRMGLISPAGPVPRPGAACREVWGLGPYLAQLLLQLQGTQHDGAANGVLHPLHTPVHGVQRQHLFPPLIHCSLAVAACPQGHDPARTRLEGGSGGGGGSRGCDGGSWVQALGAGPGRRHLGRWLRGEGTLFTTARWPH